MTSTFYLRPIALADSPQSEDGEAVRLAGGLTYWLNHALVGHVERAYVSATIWLCAMVSATAVRPAWRRSLALRSRRTSAAGRRP